MSMRKLGVLCVGVFISLAGVSTAIERSVALPYQYGNGTGTGGGNITVPPCGVTDYVAVESGKLVCRALPVSALPTCGAGSYLTASNKVLTCAPLPVSAVVPTCQDGQYLTGVSGTFNCVAAVSSTSPFKSFIIFDATGGKLSVKKSNNATIKRLQAGVYDISFPTPMSSENYAVLYSGTTHPFVDFEGAATVKPYTTVPIKSKSHVQLEMCMPGQGCFDPGYAFVGVMEP